MHRIAIIVLLLAGCTGGQHYTGLDGGDDDTDGSAPGDDAGSIDAGIDAGVDANPGTWTQPQPAAFNVDDKSDTMAKAAPSATELFFAAPPTGEMYILDVFFVTRAGPDNEWGSSRTGVGAINTSQMETEPCISVDGLEMVFRRAATLYQTKRSSVGSAWGSATTTGIDGSFPDLLADNLTMYYRDSGAVCSVDTCRTKVTRANASSAWGDPVVEEINDGGTYQFVDVSGDGLRALLSGPSTPGIAPVAIASRDSRTDPWGAAEPITELALYTGIRWAHWNWDETEMYLGFSTGANDVYVSRLER